MAFLTPESACARVQHVWSRWAEWCVQLRLLVPSRAAKPAADWTTASVRMLIRRLGIAVTLIIVALPPIGYGTLELRDLRKRADEQASLAARHVEVQLIRHRSRDWLGQISIDVFAAVSKVDNLVGRAG
jgi:hypothetical protein